MGALNSPSISKQQETKTYDPPGLGESDKGAELSAAEEAGIERNKVAD